MLLLSFTSVFQGHLRTDKFQWNSSPLPPPPPFGSADSSSFSSPRKGPPLSFPKVSLGYRNFLLLSFNNHSQPTIGSCSCRLPNMSCTHHPSLSHHLVFPLAGGPAPTYPSPVCSWCHFLVLDLETGSGLLLPSGCACETWPLPTSPASSPLLPVSFPHQLLPGPPRSLTHFQAFVPTTPSAWKAIIQLELRYTFNFQDPLVDHPPYDGPIALLFHCLPYCFIIL